MHKIKTIMDIWNHNNKYNLFFCYIVFLHKVEVGFYINNRAILTSEIQSLIISFLSDNCVEMDTLMWELWLYFCPTLYNCHLTHLTNTPPSALCFVSTALPPSIYFQTWCPPQSSVCPTKLSVAVCQSHINSQPWRGGNRAGRKMENHGYCWMDIWQALIYINTL